METGWLEGLVPAIIGAVDKGREGWESVSLGLTLKKDDCPRRRDGSDVSGPVE